MSTGSELGHFCAIRIVQRRESRDRHRLVHSCAHHTLCHRSQLQRLRLRFSTYFMVGTLIISRLCSFFVFEYSPFRDLGKIPQLQTQDDNLLQAPRDRGITVIVYLH